MGRARFALAAFILLAPGLMLAPAWRLAGLGAQEDDLLYYYPSRVLLHESLRAGELPLLNPLNGLGRPVLADPQSAIWYPTTWLVAVAPPHIAYPAGLWLHYSLALWGTIRLLRSLRLRTPAAIFGAIVFGFGAFMLAHRAHFTMQHAAAWTPWVFWRLLRYAEHGGARRLGLAALCMAAQCHAGHVQIAALTALGSLVYLSARPFGSAWPALGRWLAAWCCAGGLFAVQALATLAYMQACTRVQRGYMDFVENSWNPLSCVSLWAPMLFGQRTPNFFPTAYWGPSHQVEQLAYMGIAPLILVFASLRSGDLAGAQKRGWLVLGGFALLLALGIFGPICPILYWLPGASLFRVPARAMLLVQLAAAVIAAGAFQRLLEPRTPDGARLRAALREIVARPLWLSVVAIGLPTIVVLACLAFLPATIRERALASILPTNPALPVAFAVILGTLAALTFIVRRFDQPRTALLLMPLLVVDLGVIAWTLDVAPARGVDDLLAPPERAEWSSVVRGSAQPVWIVTARSDGKPGEYVNSAAKGVANTNLLDGVALLTDYGPLQPRSLQPRFEFKPWGETDRAAELLADTRWTQGYDVGWILVCDESLPDPDACEHVLTTSGGMRLFRTPPTRGRVYLKDAAQIGVVNVTDWSATHVAARVDTWAGESADSQTPAHGRVVAARVAIPGWSARVNGRPVAVAADETGLLAIDLPPVTGVCLVEFTYFPAWLAPGAAISTMTALGLAGGAALQRRRARRDESPRE